MGVGASLGVGVGVGVDVVVVRSGRVGEGVEGVGGRADVVLAVRPQSRLFGCPVTNPCPAPGGFV